MLHKLILSGILFSFFSGGFCQTSAIRGMVKDKITGVSIPFASIVVRSGEKQLGNSVSDFEGKYAITELPKGVLTIQSRAVGYKPIQLDRVLFKPDQIRFLDLELEALEEQSDEIQIITYHVPLIEKDTFEIGPPISSEDIEKWPGRSDLKVITSVEGVNGRKEPGKVSIAYRYKSMNGDLSLSGKILDQHSGEPVPYATIHLRLTDKIFTETIAGADGRYAITGIRGGIYTLEASAENYSPKRINQVSISSAGMNTLTVQMYSARKN